MRRRTSLAAPLLAAAAILLASLPAAGQTASDIAPADIKSGREFLAPETQAQQDDLTINPGMLWVEQGEKLWREAAGPQAKSCASCHGEVSSLKGVAVRYPALDPRLKRLLNLEGRIQNCRVEHQKAEPLAYESQALLALTAVVAHQSRGLPLKVATDGPARPMFEAAAPCFSRSKASSIFRAPNATTTIGANGCAPSASARATPTASPPIGWNGKPSARCIGA